MQTKGKTLSANLTLPASDTAYLKRTILNITFDDFKSDNGK